MNGETAFIGQKADPDSDRITVDGKPLSREGEKRYLMLNKPRGYVCTLSDEKGRPTVAELVRGCGERVYPVGRLDLDSEGLLLLTNDGEWMHHLLHPRYEVNKVYEVSVAGEVRGAAEALASMTQLDGEPALDLEDAVHTGRIALHDELRALGQNVSDEQQGELVAVVFHELLHVIANLRLAGHHSRQVYRLSSQFEFCWRCFNRCLNYRWGNM